MDQVASFASLGAGIPPQTLPLRAQSDLIMEPVRGGLDKIPTKAMDDAGIDRGLAPRQEDDLDPLVKTMINSDNWP